MEARLSLLQYALLGLLAGRTMSGYDLTKLFEQSLGHVWTARHSQIYPELKHLHEQELIAQTETGPRGRKTYATTPTGLTEVRRWLRETKPNRQPANEGLLRVFFLWLLDKDEARAYLAQEAAYHRAQTQHLKQVEQFMAASPWAERPRVQSIAIVLEAGIRHEQVMADWAEWAAKRFNEDEAGD
jgi:DNA-binding PadR family transcriptional regulator